LCNDKQINACHCNSPWFETFFCYKLYIWCSLVWTSCFLLLILSKLIFRMFLKKCCILSNSTNIWVWKKYKTVLFLSQTYLVMVYDMREVLWLWSELIIQSQSKVLACDVFNLVHIDLYIHRMIQYNITKV